MTYSANKQPKDLLELTELQDDDVVIVQREGEVVKKITKKNLLQELENEFIAPLDLTSGEVTLLYEPNDFSIVDNKLSLYVNPTVSLSGGSVNEVGATVADVSLSWVCNKEMATRDLSAPVPLEDRERGEGQNGSYTHIGANLTSNTTYTITVNDGQNDTSNSTTVSFRYRRHWGTSAETTLTDQQILNLTGSELATSRTKTWTQDGNGEYIYYCYPSAWGEATFTINGLLNTAFTLVSRNHININGATVLFNIYRTNTIQFGTDISFVVT